MTTPLARLSPDTPLRPGVGLPQVVPESVGIVHLGWGAFHRAHQAVYTEDAMALSGDLSWGILGDVERTPVLVPALREQHGRYTVLAVGQEADGSPVEQARVIASVMDVAYPGDETPRLLAAMAAPTTHVITLTVTEKGYTRRADGHLDLDQAAPDLAAFAAEVAAGLAEVADAAPAATAIGLLVRGLGARFRAGGPVVTVLSCDNMSHNGRVLYGVVSEFIEAALPGSEGDAFRTWLAASTTWPSSMVDRITPAVTDATRAQVAGLIGAVDEACVSAEPFRQWVIEDNFIGPRPQWELAGAELTSDVTPWEEAKLRMLNGTHSLLAYAGRLAGHATLAEAVRDPQILAHAREYMTADALATLEPPQGADLAAYGDELLVRFANPATGHTTRQVSTDGSQKIPFRWGAVTEWHLAHGRVPQGVAYGLAAWSEFVRRAVRDGVDLADPAADAQLKEIVAATAGGGPAAVAQALLDLPGLLPVAAVGHAGLRAAVLTHVEALVAAGDALL